MLASLSLQEKCTKHNVCVCIISHVVDYPLPPCIIFALLKTTHAVLRVMCEQLNRCCVVCVSVLQSGQCGELCVFVLTVYKLWCDHCGVYSCEVVVHVLFCNEFVLMFVVHIVLLNVVCFLSLGVCLYIVMLVCVVGIMDVVLFD